MNYFFHKLTLWSIFIRHTETVSRRQESPRLYILTGFVCHSRLTKNFYEKMETRNHFINGATPKSHTSRIIKNERNDKTIIQHGIVHPYWYEQRTKSTRMAAL